MDADYVWHKERLSKLLAVARDRKSVFVGSDLMLCFSGDRNELIPWKTLFDVRGIRAQGLHHVTPADLVRHRSVRPAPCSRRISSGTGTSFSSEKFKRT